MTPQSTTPETLTPEEQRQRAEAWYARQIETLARCYGESWPAYRAWLEDYLKAQVRQRLIEAGWRPKA